MEAMEICLRLILLLLRVLFALDKDRFFFLSLSCNIMSMKNCQDRCNLAFATTRKGLFMILISSNVKAMSHNLRYVHCSFFSP